LTDTGDPSYNPATVQAISWQAGENGEFMPENQTKDEGNDDQVFWAFAAVTAAELKFPPPTQGFPSWIGMGQAVFQTQVERWDPQNCGGGLRWQIQPTSTGYTYKNVASNGGFFQLAARLGRYTGNETYIKWAEKTWDWIETTSLLDPNTPQGTRVYDGTGIESNCKKANEQQFSYNYGILIGGLAYMYNHTEDAKWLEPLYGISMYSNVFELREWKLTTIFLQ
jgi:mannan endo-1,6-alpha-mannosidase